MLGLHRCSWTLTNRGCSLGGVQGLLTARPLITAASTVAEQKLESASSVLRCTGLVAAWQGGRPQTRDGTCVPCIGAWILNHCTTGKAQWKDLKTTLHIENFIVLKKNIYHLPIYLHMWECIWGISDEMQHKLMLHRTDDSLEGNCIFFLVYMSEVFYGFQYILYLYLNKWWSDLYHI